MPRVPVRRNEDGSTYLSWEFSEVVDGVPVKFMFAESGDRLVLTRLEIGQPFDDPEQKSLDPYPVTTELLRKIPVSRLVNDALLRWVRDIRAHGAPVSEVDRSLAAFADRAEVSAERTKPPGRPPLYDDAHFDDVLEVYESFGGRAKRQAVMQEFNFTASTAAKHIAEAKRRRAERERG